MEIRKRESPTTFRLPPMCHETLETIRRDVEKACGGLADGMITKNQAMVIYLSVYRILRERNLILAEHFRQCLAMLRDPPQS